MVAAEPSEAPQPALPAAVEAALRDKQWRAHVRSAAPALGAGLGAGLLALAALPGTPSWPQGLWLGALAGVLTLRLVLARAWGRRADAPVAGRLTTLRVVTILHGMVWGALGWVGTAPADADHAGVLILLLGGVAVGGMALLLFDRVAAIGFGAAAALPLVLRLATLPVPAPRVVPVAVAVLVLMALCLFWASTRAAHERRRLATARLVEAVQRREADRLDVLLRDVSDHVGDGICVFDRGGRLVTANLRMSELLGLDPVLAAPGTPLRTWLLAMAHAGAYGAVDPEAEADRRLADLRRPGRSIVQCQRQDGHTIETRGTSLPDGGYAMVCVDVTERVASEAALFENRRTLDVLLDRTEEGFWFIDNALQTTDCNRAMCRMLGVARSEMLGRSIYEFVDAENEAIFRAQVARRAQGEAGSYEIALRRADGALVHCWNNATPIHDAQGRRIGAIGLFSDISERKRTEALIADQSRVLATTLDSLSQGVLTIGTDGRLKNWNRRTLELLQVPAEAIATLPTLQALATWQVGQGHFGTDLERMPAGDERTRLLLTLEGTPGPGPAFEQYRRRRLDGRVIEIRLHRSPDGGEVRTFTDVTAEVDAEQALIAARDEAERANRAKSEFLSRMSHELRTPLNAILGFGQLLQRDAVEPLTQGQRARVEQILDGGQHLLSMVDEVLELTRIESGTLPLAVQPVDTGALAQACLNQLVPLARERGVMLLGPEGAAPPLRADPVRLRQVLLSLLSHAIERGHEGGRVVLRLGRAGTHARIEVQDDGPGLDAPHQQRLFQAFERPDTDHHTVEGAGLGLALSRSLIERMQGRIDVRSVPGEGCCFWIELPAADLPRLGPWRVLYIEDNDVNQLLMEGMLADRPDLALQMASLPEQGIAMARAERPDLVLLDIQLPGMTGYEVLQALRSTPALAAVPVVAVSANAMPQDRQRARAAGFDDYLTKPLDLDRLLETVDRALQAR